jgi:hypothetical protein
MITEIVGTRPQDWLRAIAQREIAYISAHHNTPKTPTGVYASGIYVRSKDQDKPDAHITLYNKLLAVAPFLIPAGEQSRATLWHCNLHSPNIFVHRNRITSIIDWENVWVGPLFWQARIPQLVAYSGDQMLELPGDYETMQDDEKAQMKDKMERSLLLRLYENKTEKLNPLLHDAFNVPQTRLRGHIIAWADSTWDTEILPFRQCLIRIHRYVPLSVHLYS